LRACCGFSVASEPQEDRAALLKKEAVKNGYGLYTRDDKFYEFDTEGSEKALAAIKASKN
jgi:hypothetical protein